MSGLGSRQRPWVSDELAYEALYPLALRLPAIREFSPRPIFVRMPRSSGDRLKPRCGFQDYAVQLDGELLCIVESTLFGHYLFRYWTIGLPRWAPAGQTLSPGQREILLGGILSAWPLAAIVDAPTKSRRVHVSNWGHYREALEKAGWSESIQNTFTPPISAGRGDRVHALLEAFWRQIGVTTIEDALASYQTAVRLAEEWGRDANPSLLRALRMHLTEWWHDMQVKREIRKMQRNTRSGGWRR